MTAYIRLPNGDTRAMEIPDPMPVLRLPIRDGDAWGALDLRLLGRSPDGRVGWYA